MPPGGTTHQGSISISTSATASANSTLTTTGSWATKTVVPRDMESGQVVAINGKIYAIGGYTGSANSSRNDEYDPVANTWSSKLAMPFATGGAAYAVCNNKAHIIGGWRAPYRQHQIYEPATNTWSFGTLLGAGRRYHGATTVGSSLYLIGGDIYTTSWADSAKNEMYNTINGTWTARTDVPVVLAWTQHQVCSVGTKVYVPGGIGASTTNREYDTVANTWADKTAMPTGREAAVAAVVNGRVYVIGGYTTDSLTTVEEFNPVSNTWNTNLKAATLARDSAPGAVCNDKIYITGGWTAADPAVNNNEEYTPPYFAEASISISATVNAIVPPQNIHTASTLNSSGHVTNGLQAYFIGSTGSGSQTSWADQSGNNNNATLTDFAFSGQSGWTGSALSSSGGDDRATISLSITTATPFTLEAWVSLDALAKAKNTQNAIFRTALYQHEANNYLYIYGTNHYFNDKILNPGILYHLVLTSNGTSSGSRLYIDGVKSEININTTDTLVPTITSIGIGQESNSMLGDIYLFRVYNRQLSSTEVVQNYNSSIGARSDIAISSSATFKGASLTNLGVDVGDQANIWTNMTAIPGVGRWRQTTSPVGTKIYMFGGRENSTLSGKNEEYDTVANTWSTKATMLTARDYLSSGAIGTKVYVVAGYTTVTRNENEEYDTVNNTWATKAVLPTSLNTAAIATYNGILYSIGGSTSSANYAYDPVQNSWTSKAAGLSYGYIAGEIGGNIYCPGTNSSATLLKCYNIDSNTWSDKANSLTTCYAGAGCVAGRKLYALGGGDKFPGNRVNQEYDPVLNSWQYKSSMAYHGAYVFSASSVADKVYAFGGSGSSSTVTEMYSPPSSAIAKATYEAASTGSGSASTAVSSTATFRGFVSDNLGVSSGVNADTWTSKQAQSVARFGSTSCTVNNKIYVIGGILYGVYKQDNEEYDPIGNTWATKANASVAKNYAACASVGTKIYYIGGKDGSTTYASTDEYDTVGNTWASKLNVTTARDNINACSIGDKVYVIGGYTAGPSNSKKNEVYDATNNTWNTKMDMITARPYNSVVAIGTKIYCITGGASWNNEEYDTIANTWATKTNIPAVRSMPSSVGIGENVYIIGGYLSGTIDVPQGKVNDIYNTRTNVWSPMSKLITGRYALTSSVANGKIYAIGGIKLPYNLNEEYTPPISISLSPKRAVLSSSTLGVSVNSNAFTIMGPEAFIGIHFKDTFTSGTFSGTRLSASGKLELIA